MNKRREHKKEVYNNLYKKYLSFLKKTSAQRNRNRLLQSSNSEFSKESIRLKEEIKKASQINSNLKAEINDLTKDEKQLMDDNRGLYNTLTTLHNDTKAFEKMISQYLKNLDPEITRSENRNSNVNRQIMNNTKDNIPLPESSYQRYNFKDIIYIQDLSPILEENPEPSDITRRLGHRARLPNSDKCSENVRVNRSVIDEGGETNIVMCSPPSARVGNFSKEIKHVEKQSVVVEKETIPDVGVHSAEKLLCSPVGSNGSNSIAANESILSSSLPDRSSESHHITICKHESDGESSLPSINIVLPSDSENTLNEKDFHSSFFANVFPRRRVLNNGCSLSLGSEEGKQEANSTSIEKENISPRVSTNSSKNDVDQSNIRIRSDSFLKSNLTISCDLESETSHQGESLLGKTCSDLQQIIEDITSDIKGGMETQASAVDGLTDKLSLDSSLLKKIKEDGNARNESNMELLSESAEEQSSNKSILDASSKTPQEKESDVKPLSRTADKNSVKSAKCSTPGRKSLEDSKKSLRPKKPLNFTESPIIKMNSKRKRKLEKAVK